MKYMQPKIMVIVYLHWLIKSKSNNTNKGWGEGSEELKAGQCHHSAWESYRASLWGFEGQGGDWLWANTELPLGTFCFTSMIAFCNEVIGSVDEGRAVDVAYDSFSKYSLWWYPFKVVEIWAG